MWVNSQKIESSVTIAANLDATNFNCQLIQPVIKWAKANPEAKVYLWYDSAHTTKQAIEDSKSILDEALRREEISNAELKDVREIPCVMNNLDTFTQAIPIYFRVDLLKLIILLDSIEREGFDSAVFSDLEVGDMRPTGGRMNKHELFNQNVCNDFERIGFIAGSNIRDSKSCPENQFLQLYRNPCALDVIRHTINICLSVAINALTKFDVNDQFLGASSLSSSVYSAMFSLTEDLFRAIDTKSKMAEPILIDPHTGSIKHDGIFLSLRENFIPLRDMTLEVRHGRFHGPSRQCIKQPPANGESYACSLLPYQTQVVCTILGLSDGKEHIVKRKISKKDVDSSNLPAIGIFARPASFSDTKHEIITLLNNSKLQGGAYPGVVTAISRKENGAAIMKVLQNFSKGCKDVNLSNRLEICMMHLEKKFPDLARDKGAREDLGGNRM